MRSSTRSSPKTRPKNLPRLHDFLAEARRRLEAEGIEDASREARLLLCSALKMTRADLLSQEPREATAEETFSFQDVLARRAAREPLTRIEGGRSFWGLWFETNEATLDPRPDSETLVEQALRHRPKNKTPRLLDLGTGTGCLLLSLLKEWEEAEGTGIDKAPRALEAARKNAETLALTERARFLEGTWEDNLACLEDDTPFDMILSNPPYIETKEIETLDPEVRNYDPTLALDGGADGLEAYRKIIPLAHEGLVPGGTLLLEIGATQAAAVKALLEAAGFKDITLTQDLASHDRVLAAKR